MQDLADFVYNSRYAKPHERYTKRLESWEEATDVILAMHERQIRTLQSEPAKADEILSLIREVVRPELIAKRILGSQRVLQFKGFPIEKHNARLYNCAASYADRPRFFQEAAYLLLCGCGVGFSVQEHHVAQLPPITAPNSETTFEYTVPDSIEGLSLAFSALLSSYFTTNKPMSEVKNKTVIFDWSLIRPKGSPISAGGRAPGAGPTIKAVDQIRVILDRALERDSHARVALHPIEVYDIMMFIANSIISGGVRRSATIALFTVTDMEMVKAKTGDWYIENPQRGRSNNSAVLLRNDPKTEENFKNLFTSVRQFGEPGFVFSDSTEIIFNPCVEVGLYAKDEQGRSGFQMCNLTEINMKIPTTANQFLRQCEAAAILGTIQASYTTLPFLGPITEYIVRREALIGVSMTGMSDNPRLAFDWDLQRRGAELVKATNKRVAALLNINPSPRCCCIKPAGTTSCILSTASGIHPHHSRRYIRRVQANKQDPALQFWKTQRPMSVEPSAWNENDEIVSFLIEPKSDAIVKSDISAVHFIDLVRQTQQNWVEAGTDETLNVFPGLRHNVSNTCVVRQDEWSELECHIFQNRHHLAGISLIPVSGDYDFIQAPLQDIPSSGGLVATYGDATLFCSGLIVHAYKAFNNSLYNACAAIQAYEQAQRQEKDKIKNSSVSDKDQGKEKDQDKNKTLLVYQEGALDRLEAKAREEVFVFRAIKFAHRYFHDDLSLMIQALKQVDALKTWNDMDRHVKTQGPVVWERYRPPRDDSAAGLARSLARQDREWACSGTSCELKQI